MNRLALLLLLLGGSACAAPKDTSLLNRTKATVQNQLKDPESARFRNLIIVRGSVCGEVNAKNSFGGYVGFKRFVAIGGVVAMIDNDEPPFQGTWDSTCLKNPPKPAKPPEYYEESWKDLK